MQDDFSAGVYSAKFSHYGQDYIAASTMTTSELQIFEKDLVYMPSWTISDIPQGVTDLDISPIGDLICFANGANGLDLINVGRII